MYTPNGRNWRTSLVNLASLSKQRRCLGRLLPTGILFWVGAVNHNDELYVVLELSPRKSSILARGAATYQNAVQHMYIGIMKTERIQKCLEIPKGQPWRPWPTFSKLRTVYSLGSTTESVSTELRKFRVIHSPDVQTSGCNVGR